MHSALWPQSRARDGTLITEIAISEIAEIENSPPHQYSPAQRACSPPHRSHSPASPQAHTHAYAHAYPHAASPAIHLGHLASGGAAAAKGSAVSECLGSLGAFGYQHANGGRPQYRASLEQSLEVRSQLL